MIYLVLPIYNEKENIQKIIPELRQIMKGQDYKIVAVNDGSSDGSAEVLEQMQGDDLMVTGTKINMNIGAVFSLAIHKVLEHSNNDNDVLVIMEGDQTSECGIVKDMAVEIEQNGQDVVIGSRYQKGGHYKDFPLPRLIYSWGASFFMRKLFPIKGDIKDYTIFFRAYRVGVLRQLTEYFGIFGFIQSRGFVANAELLVKISLFTKKIKEVPFVYDYGRKKGKSKMRIFRTINEYFVFVCYMKDFIKRFRRKVGS